MGADFKNTRACLLGAGNGKRAGGPKAWHPYQGKTLLEHQLNFLLKIFPPNLISISIQKEWLEKCTALNAQVRWVMVDPHEPPIASLMALLRGQGDGRWGFLYHVDMPVWELELWRKLYQVIPEAQSYAAIMPRYENKGGHPVILSPQAQEDILKLDSQKDRLDFWLHSQKVKMVNVPFECIHENWNQPVKS